MIHLDFSWSWVFLAALAEGVSTLFNKETVSLANSHLEGRTRNPESVVDCELIANVTISCYDELMLMDVLGGRVQALS